MGDYNLEGLNPRDFQHLVQAIARENIAAGITAFGDGRDGNRDLSYKGIMDYPSHEDKWDGYLVVGCKFNQHPTGDSSKDKAWAIKQLESDLKKFLNKRRKLQKPQYYIFVTNVRLSSVPKTGGRDQVAAVLKAYSPKLNLKNYGIWDYSDLRGFLDGNASLRSAYGHLVTAGDVLAEMMQILKLERPDFVEVMHTFLQKELIADMSAKLQSAGEDPDVHIPLAKVFVDLPYAESAEAAVLVSPDEEEKLPTVVYNLLEAGAAVLRQTSQTGIARGERRSKRNPRSRFVIVGGPGQGKSTFGQYLCQLYRAAILDGRPTEKLDERVPGILKLLSKQRKDSGGLPLTRRFPVRIELRNFAHALAADPQLTLIEYIRRDIGRLGSSVLSLSDLKTWLENYPWLLVLDGLDEVPPSSNRTDVLREIDSFRVDAASCNSDMLVVATTRPQSYSKEFSDELFHHLYLTPLSPKQALNYGSKLAEARSGADERRRDELVRSLEKACRNPATSRLMQSPLQVTIMATLLEDTGEPPQQRYRLFAEYYRTIYKRETRRKLLGGILTERQTDIDTIHAQAGLILQAAAEQSKPSSVGVDDVDSALSDEEFRELVRRRLVQIGITAGRVRELLDRISDGSLQRLVFLVRPREGWVRFDITSLKEFMAAEAIMNGSDDDVRERLKVIAPTSYWRNVFQFAVGKCFVEREHLLDNLVSLCTGLNESKPCEDIIASATGGRAANAVLWGSRLALDILSDGTARQYPGYELRFARLALQLVKLPDPEICARLASVFHEDLKELYVEVLNDRLGQTNLWSKLGAFRLLVSLADEDERWAMQMLATKWPTDPEFETAVMFPLSIRKFSKWGIKKLEEVMPRLEPALLRRYLQTYYVQSSEASHASTWEKLLRLIYHQGRDRGDVVNRSFWNDVVQLFYFTKTHVDRELWESVKDIKFQNPNWFPYVAGARFGANPSAESLSSELKWLAESWQPHTDIWWFNLPWPLALCLVSAESSENLLQLADAAKAGLLGDTKHWTAAERRWLEEGISDNDFRNIRSTTLPLSPEISTTGFPFVVSSWSSSDGTFVNPVSVLIDNLQAIQDIQLRSHLASMILSGKLDYPKGDNLAVELRQLYSLAGDSRVNRRSLQLDALLQVVPESPLPADWVDLLDWLGGKDFWISGRTPQCELAQELATHFCLNPVARKGLFKIISELVSDGCKCQIPMHILNQAKSWDDESRDHALCLRVARNDVTTEDFQLIAEEILQSDRLTWLVWRALKIVSNKSQSQAAELALALLGRMTGESSKRVLDASEQARRILNAFLTTKPSLIQLSDTWKQLNLPEKIDVRQLRLN